MCENKDIRINLFHVFLVAPLLYKSSYDPDTAEYLKYVAFGVAGFHLYKISQITQNN
jgi:hypothetical protein